MFLFFMPFMRFMPLWNCVSKKVKKNLDLQGLKGDSPSAEHRGRQCLSMGGRWSRFQAFKDEEHQHSSSLEHQIQHPDLETGHADSCSSLQKETGYVPSTCSACKACRLWEFVAPRIFLDGCMAVRSAAYRWLISSVLLLLELL